MKSQTLRILENFASINSGMLFRQGNVLRVMNISQTVFASATVEDTFPKEFAIYDVPELLKAINLFDEFEVEYMNDYITIKGSGRSVKYHYSMPAVVVAPPAKNPAEITNPLLKFTLTSEMLDKINRSAAVLRLNELLLDGDKKEMVVFNRGDSGNEYRIQLGDDAAGVGSAILSIANLKMLPVDYIVSVSDKMVEFKSTSGNDLIYVIGRENEV